MTSLVEIIILGIIQGITEWLPVSSSGHLVLAQEFFQIAHPLILDVMLHLGTVIVVIVFFRQDIINIIRALAKGDLANEDGRLALYVIIGTIPVAIVGYALRNTIESLFENALAVGTALLFTGFLLFFSEWRESNKKLGFLDSLFIGLAQVVSIIPGISRSGATISTGLLRGVEKEKVVRYSFLLSVPAILGATALEVKDALVQNVDWFAILIGVIVSMIVGYLALNALLRIVTKRKFHYFAYYCWALGLIVILLLLLR
jgi:undecaprenyl-diphosphatase